MDEMRLFVSRAAARAAVESGASTLTRHSEELALIMISMWPDSDTKKVRAEFRRRHKEVGSVFLIIVLPIIVSILSKWITEWIWNHRTDQTRISQAATATLSN